MQLDHASSILVCLKFACKEFVFKFTSQYWCAWNLHARNFSSNLPLNRGVLEICMQGICLQIYLVKAECMHVYLNFNFEFFNRWRVRIALSLRSNIRWNIRHFHEQILTNHEWIADRPFIMAKDLSTSSMIPNLTIWHLIAWTKLSKNFAISLSRFCRAIILPYCL